MSRSLNGRKTDTHKHSQTTVRSQKSILFSQEGKVDRRRMKHWVALAVFSSVGASLTKNWVHESKKNKRALIDCVLILNIQVRVTLRRNNFSWFGYDLNTLRDWATSLEWKAPSALGLRAVCSYLVNICFQTFLNLLITQCSHEMKGTICKRAGPD